MIQIDDMVRRLRTTNLALIVTCLVMVVAAELATNPDARSAHAELRSIRAAIKNLSDMASNEASVENFEAGAGQALAYSIDASVANALYGPDPHDWPDAVTTVLPPGVAPFAPMFGIERAKHEVSVVKMLENGIVMSKEFDEEASGEMRSGWNDVMDKMGWRSSEPIKLVVSAPLWVVADGPKDERGCIADESSDWLQGLLGFSDQAREMVGETSSELSVIRDVWNRAGSVLVVDNFQQRVEKMSLLEVESNFKELGEELNASKLVLVLNEMDGSGDIGKGGNQAETIGRANLYACISSDVVKLASKPSIPGPFSSRSKLRYIQSLGEPKTMSGRQVMLEAFGRDRPLDLDFASAFPNLSGFTSNYPDLTVDELDTLLTAESKRSGSRVVFFGAAIPVEKIGMWASIVLVAQQAYFFLHLHAFRRRLALTRGSARTEVAWIGLYPSIGARLATVASSCVLPPFTLLLLIVMTPSGVASLFGSAGEGLVARSVVAWSSVLVSLAVGVATAQVLTGKRPWRVVR